MKHGIAFCIPGAPRTKKNHGRVIVRGGRRYHVQSVAHEDWNQAAQLWLAKIRAKSTVLPLRGSVRVKAVFFRDANRGDFTGYAQALGDALEEGGIIENDRQIANWDGSYCTKDAANPRIEVEITQI